MQKNNVGAGLIPARAAMKAAPTRILCLIFKGEVTVDDLKHLVSDKAIQGETMLLNMGPQHPSTHGVLRLLLELDGETVINCIPRHRFPAHWRRKNMEAKTYQKAEVMSDRLDYMNTVQPGLFDGGRETG